MKLSSLLFSAAAMMAATVWASEPAVQESRYLWPADYMADPAAHVFDGKVYIYTSHDWDSPVTD
ncbi:MAG: hypothetical protein K2H98_03325, partial [Duncaniella sp.]|nr:hypothetical protein [Duncaniella sp.]